MKKKFITASVIGALVVAGSVFFVGAKVVASFQESTTNKNAKFADAAWWRTATPADVRKEIKKGASVKRFVVLDSCDSCCELCDCICSSAAIIVPLIIAAENNTNPEVIKTLIEAGADVNAYGGAALRNAVRSITNPEVIKVLIEAGADVNADGGAALRNAAGYNTNPEVIKALIEAGADVNAKDGQGRTALTWARLERKWEIVKMLIEAGA